MPLAPAKGATTGSPSDQGLPRRHTLVMPTFTAPQTEQYRDPKRSLISTMLASDFDRPARSCHGSAATDLPDGLVEAGLTAVRCIPRRAPVIDAGEEEYDDAVAARTGCCARAHRGRRWRARG